MGLSHPDLRQAEDAARLVLEGRVKNLWPELIGASEHQVSAMGVNTKRQCLYLNHDESESIDRDESDDEDWYGDKALTATMEL